MTLFFDLAVLGGVVIVLLLLGWGAVNAGVDTRPGFGEDEHYIPGHHDIRGSI